MNYASGNYVDNFLVIDNGCVFILHLQLLYMVYVFQCL